MMENFLSKLESENEVETARHTLATSTHLERALVRSAALAYALLDELGVPETDLRIGVPSVYAYRRTWGPDEGKVKATANLAIWCVLETTVQLYEHMTTRPDASIDADGETVYLSVIKSKEFKSEVGVLTTTIRIRAELPAEDLATLRSIGKVTFETETPGLNYIPAPVRLAKVHCDNDNPF